MKRRTTTLQLQQAVTNNLLQIISAEAYSKSTRKTTAIPTDTFKYSLDIICETVLASCIGWHYERDYKTNGYIAECSRMDGCAENIVTVHLRVNDSSNVEEIERILKIEEE
ncbi:hypothetical protein D7V86_24050 [bacterium D16-51]|nr:hypothetical protein D7V96_24075 [bacterium D16-59]RKI54180.1 hypothetical protein D7V86_24050 [bacterium D16-51]